MALKSHLQDPHDSSPACGRVFQHLFLSIISALSVSNAKKSFGRSNAHIVSDFNNLVYILFAPLRLVGKLFSSLKYIFLMAYSPLSLVGGVVVVLMANTAGNTHSTCTKTTHNKMCAIISDNVWQYQELIGFFFCANIQSQLTFKLLKMNLFYRHVTVALKQQKIIDYDLALQKLFSQIYR